MTIKLKMSDHTAFTPLEASTTLTLIPFTTVHTTITYQPYHEPIEQVVPTPGLIFTIADNGYGSGGATSYVVKTVDQANRYGFPKSFTASSLYKFYKPPEPGWPRSGEVVILWDPPSDAGGGPGDVDPGRVVNKATTGRCVVKNEVTSFTFKARNGEAYYKETIDNLAWGLVIKESRFDK